MLSVMPTGCILLTAGVEYVVWFVGLEVWSRSEPAYFLGGLRISIPYIFLMNERIFRCQRLSDGVLGKEIGAFSG